MVRFQNLIKKKHNIKDCYYFFILTLSKVTCCGFFLVTLVSHFGQNCLLKNDGGEDDTVVKFRHTEQM